MGAASFFFGFLAVGVIGAEMLASFETVPSERIGASAFLLVLCLAASAISTLAYAESSQRLRRRPRWFTGLFGGVVAAGTFCASASAGYAGLGFGYLMALMLLLPSLLGVLWAFLSAKTQEGQRLSPVHHNSN